MLEEKLKLARARNQQKRRAFLLFFIVVSIVSAALLIGVSYLDFQTEDTQRKAKDEIALEDSATINPDQENRENFLSLLEEYEAELEPEIKKSNLEAWNKEAADNISNLKKIAVTSFGEADYPKAVSNIESLINRSESILAERDALFDDAFVKAESAFTNDSYENAKNQIDKALTYKPLWPEAQQLEEKINQLSRIVPLLGEARIARSENNIQKERDALSEILEIDPGRRDDQVRFDELTQLLINNSFNNHISRANNYLDNADAQAARNEYSLAKNVDKTRPELKPFEEKLLALEKKNRVNNLLGEAESAVRNDDWESAQKFLVKAKQESPLNKEVVEKLERSNQVVSTTKKIDQYLSDPYQLSSLNKRNEARALMEASRKIAGHSYNLKNRVSSLSTLLTKMEKDVAVKIISDNKTNILVRGVGKVGQTDEKTIYLKPGEYTFEGLRKGYRSELIKTQIPYDKNVFDITIICDEPI